MGELVPISNTENSANGLALLTHPSPGTRRQTPSSPTNAVRPEARILTQALGKLQHSTSTSEHTPTRAPSTACTSMSESILRHIRHIRQSVCFCGTARGASYSRAGMQEILAPDFDGVELLSRDRRICFMESMASSVRQFPVMCRVSRYTQAAMTALP
jgi:hypothetical protein